MADYQRVPTVKIARPDTPEGYMIVNAADYREGLPQQMYDDGVAYNPVDWPRYVESGGHPTARVIAPKVEEKK